MPKGDDVTTSAIATVDRRILITADDQRLLRQIRRSRHCGDAVRDDGTHAPGALLIAHAIGVFTWLTIGPHALQIAIGANAREDATVGEHQQPTIDHRQAGDQRKGLIAVEHPRPMPGQPRNQDIPRQSTVILAVGLHPQIGGVVIGDDQRHRHDLIHRHRCRHQRIVTHAGTRCPPTHRAIEVERDHRHALRILDADGGEAIAHHSGHALPAQHGRIADPR